MAEEPGERPFPAAGMLSRAGLGRGNGDRDRVKSDISGAEAALK